MLDEFANVALPDDFCSLLSTMRSREISSIIIIQNFAQLKALFKDTWETIPGNCDTFIYLGGNEQSTHKYVSELLGKGTIDKKSNGETKGRQGSSSRNYDVLGRELFTPDEAEQKAKIDRGQANELEYVDESQKSDAADSANASNGSTGAKPVRNPEREKPKWEDTITNRMLHWSYTPEQKEEVKKALAAGVPKATILTYFYPEVTVEKMSSYRNKH